MLMLASALAFQNASPSADKASALEMIAEMLESLQVRFGVSELHPSVCARPCSKAIAAEKSILATYHSTIVPFGHGAAKVR